MTLSETRVESTSQKGDVWNLNVKELHCVCSSHSLLLTEPTWCDVAADVKKPSFVLNRCCVPGAAQRSLTPGSFLQDVFSFLLPSLRAIPPPSDVALSPLLSSLAILPSPTPFVREKEEEKLRRWCQRWWRLPETRLPKNSMKLVQANLVTLFSSFFSVSSSPFFQCSLLISKLTMHFLTGQRQK